jgi:hypothetical protein
MSSVFVQVSTQEHQISREKHRIAEEQRHDRETSFRQEREKRDIEKAQKLKKDQEKREDQENHKKMPKPLGIEEKRLQTLRQKLRECGIRPDF